jgi:acetyl esterase/lipase
MPYDVQSDGRLDPRLRAVLALIDVPELGDVADRQQLLDEAASPEGIAAALAAEEMMAFLDSEEVAPSTGLTISDHEVESQPDGNTITLRFIRPDGDTPLACVYYIHGGGMATGSINDAIYRAWPRVIAAKGVAVVMVEFRNAVRPNSKPEVAPFPAGLYDCLSGLQWVAGNASSLSIDPERIVVAGESGGGNLTLAVGMSLRRTGELGLIKGLYALCPYLVGKYPDDRYPSTVENNGILIEGHNNRGIVGYGIDAYEEKNPLAWPDFATTSDVIGLPATVITVNECDPLRDEGVAFYRLLLQSGVPARGRIQLGTFHGADLATALCPEISHGTALDLATFAKG